MANAKGIYIDLLEYFGSHPDTLFIVVTAPPLSDDSNAANARALNEWLVNDWLKDYPVNNVFVYDFYNVLTTNGGSSTLNDLDSATGNHHRWWSNDIQHLVDLSHNTSAYPNSSSDDHPTVAGNQKATAEYVPLLNYAYNRWMENRTPYVVDFSANASSGIVPVAVQFTDLSTVTTPTEWNWSFGDGQQFTTSDPAQKDANHTYLTPGTYKVKLEVTNASGTFNRSRSAYITAKPWAANFTANATYGTAHMDVLFTDTSTGSVTAWNWSFGDGEYSELQNPVHTYLGGGNFTVIPERIELLQLRHRNKTGLYQCRPGTFNGTKAGDSPCGNGIFRRIRPSTSPRDWRQIPRSHGSSPMHRRPSTVPNWTIDVTGQERRLCESIMTIFAGRTGTWYSWAGVAVPWAAAPCSVPGR